MSGTAISPGMVRNTAINATWALDKKLHCRSFNSSELLDCFRKQLKDEILDFHVSSYCHEHPTFNLVKRKVSKASICPALGITGS